MKCRIIREPFSGKMFRCTVCGAVVLLGGGSIYSEYHDGECYCDPHLKEQIDHFELEI